jgi:hypothetical protein
MASPTIITIGMRLDDLVHQVSQVGSHVDNLNSTQLYGLIVAATVGLCVVLLGTGNPAELEQQQPKPKSKWNNNMTNLKTTGKQPRWHVFRWVNYLFVGAFLWSVATFLLNASQYLHHDSQGVLAQFLVGWSVFLCYFFGFFGISLVHQDIQENVQEEERYVRHWVMECHDSIHTCLY